MALTLEALFDAYMNTGEYDLGEGEGLDFATDLYNWFGLPEGGIGAKEFADKYSMYIPTYDPTEEHLAYQDKYLAFRNAGETHNLSKALTEELYSTEMENVSGALGKEVSKGKQMAGGLGLRSGTLESALEDTMDIYGGKAKDIGKQYDLKKTGDLNAYNTKLVDATLDYDKSEHRIKQDFYDEVMASMMRLSERGAFDEYEGYVPGCTEEQIATITGGGNLLSTCTDPGGNILAAGWYNRENYKDKNTGELCTCTTLNNGETICDPPDCDPDWTSGTEGSQYCDPWVDDPDDPMYCGSTDTTPDEKPGEFNLEGGGCHKVESSDACCNLPSWAQGQAAAFCGDVNCNPTCYDALNYNVVPCSEC